MAKEADAAKEAMNVSAKLGFLGFHVFDFAGFRLSFLKALLISQTFPGLLGLPWPSLGVVNPIDGMCAIRVITCLTYKLFYVEREILLKHF